MAGRARIATVAAFALAAFAQDLDTITATRDSKPFIFLDQLDDPAERATFETLHRTRKPEERLRLATVFIESRPQSWLLAFVHEIAAKAALDLGNRPLAVAHSRRSLRFYPENAAVLVPLATMYLRDERFQDAAATAREALDVLDRFARPSTIELAAWPFLERQLRASAHYAIARATLSTRGPAATAISHLRQSIALIPGDQDALYLLGVAYSQDAQPAFAAWAFAQAARIEGALAARAKAEFEKLPPPAPSLPPSPTEPASTGVGAYVGSASCRECHAVQHTAWLKTGMARMLRPYQAANVIADFSAASPVDSIRPVVDNKRHAFSVRTPSGWRQFPITHTIGSKWQQAFATQVPGGGLHVFPIQYNRLEKTWLNYWRLIDTPNSPRADPAAFHRLTPATHYQSNCAPCHTSQLQGTWPGELSFREEGVNCEMCHGPSLDHARSMREGKRARVPRFRDLAPAVQNAVCAQCHAQSALHPPESFASAPPSWPPRYQSRPLAEFSRRAFYKDGRLRETTFISEALLRTMCWKKGQVTCAHCHDPHPPDAETNLTSLKFAADPDRMCTQCHASTRPHSRHAASSEASRCVSCHMPRIMNSVLFMARTHQIDDKPDLDMFLRFGQAESPNACIGCHQNKDGAWLRTQMALR